MMRSVRWYLRSAAICLGLAFPFRAASGSIRIDTLLLKETLAENVYLFRAPSDLDRWTATNAVVIVNEDDVVVFDSNSRARTARMVIAEIRKITSKPVRTLINSHWHLDHWSGNDEYQKAFPGLRIIATTETRDYMRSMTSNFFADNLSPAIIRTRARIDTATRAGRLGDGTAVSAAGRDSMKKSLAETEAFAAEIRATPRVLPNIVYRDTLVFWSGKREFRLISATGDATGSTVLHLPGEKMLVMGDVLVRPEDGDGPPPWTTNSYAITPWLNSLRSLGTLDVSIVVPGQGAALQGKNYLNTTADMFAAIISQVRAALERGIVTVADVQKTIDVGEFARRYQPGIEAPSPAFHRLVASLVRKVHQEALDGVIK